MVKIKYEMATGTSPAMFLEELTMLGDKGFKPLGNMSMAVDANGRLFYALILWNKEYQNHSDEFSLRL